MYEFIENNIPETSEEIGINQDFQTGFPI